MDSQKRPMLHCTRKNHRVCFLSSNPSYVTNLSTPCFIKYSIMFYWILCELYNFGVNSITTCTMKNYLTSNMNSFYFLRTSVVDIWWVQLFNGPYSRYKNVNKPHQKLLWNWSLKVYRSWGKVTLLLKKKDGNEDWLETNPHISE